ncbi:DUF499 domain-containing protein [Sphingobium fluviale]|uniref:DUF499 domain-containing protein n=1 Tax=Sphingobium fluviale TaxID=2506423 RepID=A0A4Q1KD20_9SPHN|nr:DUF499 domain-containing protein [Sphingobium fluviale]RXR25229.1 DUF499 domain-containing protein [Sphingobium fluviale]
MKPWREVAVPHRDVLEGTFQQSEFAADITAVKSCKASHEYQDAVAFYERTFITEGMAMLLTQVAQRLAGKGGEPVVQLQTAFGGGKTHTMLAVYHLATRKCALAELSGIPALVDRAGLMDVPQARVAVIDGTDRGPSQSRMYSGQAVRTLWGELAWQLGGAEGFALVAESDAAGTSPGKEVLRELLERYSPCVVLIDELVAYVRQFPESQAIRSGSASRDFFATAYGEREGKYEGFSFGGGEAVFDDTLLLIDPDAAKSYEEANRPAEPASPAEPATTSVTGAPPAGAPPSSEPGIPTATPQPASVKPKVFYGTAEIPPATAKMHLVNLADEIIALLASDPNANVRLTVEISAEFPDGASDSIKRAVSENANSLRLKSADWE